MKVLRTVSKMISLLVMAFFLSGLFGLYTVSCCLLWLECNTVPCICQAVFFGGWVFPLRGKFFQRPRRRCFFRAGVLCFTRGRTAANSPPVPDCQASGDVVEDWPPALYLFTKSRSRWRNSSMVLPRIKPRFTNRFSCSET